MTRFKHSVDNPCMIGWKVPQSKALAGGKWWLILAILSPVIIGVFMI